GRCFDRAGARSPRDFVRAPFGPHPRRGTRDIAEPKIALKPQRRVGGFRQPKPKRGGEAGGWKKRRFWPSVCLGLPSKPQHWPHVGNFYRARPFPAAVRL